MNTKVLIDSFFYALKSWPGQLVISNVEANWTIASDIPVTGLPERKPPTGER
jgi:hypothetical protein